MKTNHEYKSRFRILKGGKIALVITALIGSITMLSAAPSDGVVTTGTASISQTANTTTITQTTNKASINWQSFSVAPTESVNFVQPSSSSITLNRVVGVTSSLIEGAINANGQVFLLNPNGIIFSQGSSVNVGGLVASTLNMSDTDFLNGNYVLLGSSSASVLNQGDITTANGGYVVLAAKSVTNEGAITSQEGNVQLASGEQISLNINGNSLLSLSIDKGTYDALISNKGIIEANGGAVYLTSKAMDSVLSGVVNNSGVIEAQSIGTEDGKIVLFAHGGTLQAGGSLDTGAGNGFIETSGEVFASDDTLSVTTGEWLIDPVDLTIDSTLASTISTTLNGGADVTELATNDITVSAPIQWNSNTLTLNAGNNIYINAQLDLINTAGLSLEYGQAAVASGNTATYNVNAPVNLASTGSFSTKLGSDGLTKTYTIITSLGSAGSTTGTDLQGIKGSLSTNYVLGANIDASTTSSWNSGAGFEPIGNWATRFTGIFDGLGHTVDSLNINRPGTDFVGLFGVIQNNIQNIGVTNVNIVGKMDVGALAGYFTGSQPDRSISNSYATGSVSGTSIVGGLVGWSYDNILRSYATTSVSGTGNVGGLLGFNSSGTVSNSYATGSVSGTVNVGGLVGDNSGSVSNSYATGSVSGDIYFSGGLVGKNSSLFSSVSNSFWNTTTSGKSSDKASSGSTGLTTLQMADNSNFLGWDSSVWSYSAPDSTVAGYQAGSYPYLANVTVSSDINKVTLFTDGLGTSVSPYTITNWKELQNINYNSTTLSKYYTLSNDLGTSISDYSTYASSSANSGAGFIPIGDNSSLNNNTRFTGTFDGLGHTIDSLFINRSSTNYVGLFGFNSGTIQNVGVTNADIKGYLYVGSLVGNSNGTISNSYATGSVRGTSDIGGFVGDNYGTISNSYTTASVSGDSYIGGLVGRNLSTISNSYATGSVSGTGVSIGGLVGRNFATVTNSFWNTTSGTSTGIGAGTTTGATGLTATQMQQQSSFSDFDFTNTWVIYDGHTYPLLRTFMTPLTVTANSATKTYDGTANDTNGVSYSLTPDSNLLGTLAYSGNANVGTHTVTPSGLYSNQQGYIITYANGTLTINPKTLLISATKTYDGSTDLTGAVTLSGLVGSETLGYNGATANSKNAGSGNYISAITLQDGTGLISNYTLPILNSTNAPVTINAKALNITGLAANNKTYDGTTSVTISDWGSISTGVGSETLVLNHGSASFSDKNIGNGKTVTASGYSLADGTNGGLASNYSLASSSVATTADITPDIADITLNNQVLEQTKIPVKNGTAFRIDEMVQENNLVNIPPFATIVNGGIKLPIGLVNDDEL